MTPEHERWAETLAVERQHGKHAPAFISERIRTLALAGDMEGAKRWDDIARRHERLMEGTPQ